MRIVFIGAGRLAYSLAPALREAGHDIMQVYSRTLASAQSLAAVVGAQPITDLHDVKGGADVYLFAVTDSSLPLLAQQLGALLRRHGAQDASVFLHTAGSIGMSVFQSCTAHYGVLYPMQTFSKARAVDFSSVHFFIEAATPALQDLLQAVAASVVGPRQVHQLDSEGRKRLHLAAVFACNFVNHCCTLAADVLRPAGVAFDVVLPLLDETVAKLHQMAPAQAQTGPAARHDQSVMQAHCQLLAEQPHMQHIYNMLSQSIENYTKNDQLRPD